MPVAVFACFLHRKKSIPNGVQTQQKFLENFSRPEDTCWAQEVLEGSFVESTTHQGVPGGPGTPRWVVPTSVVSRTASLPYKYPNILETLGELMKHSSSRRKFQNHNMPSRALFWHSVGGEHDHGGVHHPHWCLPDDA